MPQNAGPVGYAQAEMVYGVQGKEGFNGVVAHKPGKDRQEQTQSAFVGVIPYFAQACEHIGFNLGFRVFLGFFDENENHEG